MFCLYCGNKLPEDAIFCNECGRRQHEASLNAPGTDITIVSVPSLSGAPMDGEQSSVGNVPQGQGTPTTIEIAPSGQSISSAAASAAPSISVSPEPPRATSSAPQTPTQHAEQQSYSSEARTYYQIEPQTQPAHHSDNIPQHTTSDRLRFTSNLSRRTVIVGLAGATTVAIVGGSLVWMALFQNHKSFPSSSSLSNPTLAPLGTTLFIYRGHSRGVSAVAWSPDGKRIVSGSFDWTVQIWNAADGGNVYMYTGHAGSGNGYVHSVAWSPDGKRIASASEDKTVQVWDASDGGNVYIYTGHTDAVRAVAWSPNGKRIASTSTDTTVQVWDASNGGNVYIYRGHSSIPNGFVNSVAWSPDGKRIASASDDGTVQVWDASDGGNVYIYHGSGDPVQAVSWSPDGKRIASGGEDEIVQVWDAVDGGNAYSYRGHSQRSGSDIAAHWVQVVTWSRDGKRIASGSQDKTVQVWNARDGKNSYTYHGHSDVVWAAAWSPDGKRIASGSNDRTVQVWQAV